MSSPFRGLKRRRGRIALSLRLRFLAFVIVLTGGLGCAFIGLDLLAELNTERQSNREHATTIQSVVRSIAEVSLRDYHYLSLETLLEQIASAPDIVSVAIYDWRRNMYLDGDPLTPLGRIDVIPVLIADAYSRGEVFQASDGLLTVAFPIPVDGDTVAAAQLVFTVPTTADLLSDLLTHIGWITGISILIIASLAWIMLGRVLLPLQQLTDACRRVGRGEIDVEVATQRHDEIGLLAVRFRRMLRQLRRNIDRINRLAFVDGVTNLPNREHFRRAADRAIEVARSTGYPGAVLFIDLDRFKRVNDTLGHDFGDILLREFAQRLGGCVRATDSIARIGDADPLDPFKSSPSNRPTIARLGGDEFSLLLPQMRVGTDAAIVARRILRAARQPFELKGHRVFVGASIGIANFPDDGQTLDDVLRAADLALYQAKDQGRGTFEFFSSSLNKKAIERFVLENELRRAIENEQFVLYYQPIVDPRCGSLRAVEALLRWRHPTRGLVEPGAFIGVAEETRMIIEIGTWVLRAACRQAKAWHRAGRPIKVSVNVSLAQFERPGFADAVLAILEEVDLVPELLQLEITESLAMSDPEHTAAMIAPLRAAGVSFALDDFGTGYSSLSILSSLPFDGLKIDRSFISQADTDPTARVIVETILAMARSLQFATIAEGIEQPAQADFLSTLGCDLVQGYLYSRPIPAAALEMEFFASPAAAKAR